jgi:hypothetical protein
MEAVVSALGDMAPGVVERAARRTVALIHHTADEAAADVWARALEPHYHVVRFTEHTIGAMLGVPTLFLLSADAFADKGLYHLGTLAFHRGCLRVIAYHSFYMAGIWGLRTGEDGALYRDPVVTSAPVFPRSGKFIEDGDHGAAIEEALAALGGWQS